MKQLLVGSLLAVGCAGAAAPAEPVVEEHPRAAPMATAIPAAPEPEPFPRVPVLDCTVSEQVGYRRGRSFPIDAVTIDGRLVELETASAYWAMQQAAAADGVELPIYSAFRTNEEQTWFYDCYKSCSCNSCTQAARPRYSKHQSGRAIDFGQWDGVSDWLSENAARFRFRATIRKEPWHWEYRPRRKRRVDWPSVCVQQQ